MKKFLVLLASLLLLFSLSSCALSRKPYSVQKGLETYVIDPGAQTISDGTQTYKYNIRSYPGGACISLTFDPHLHIHYRVYPNGTVDGPSSRQKAQAKLLADLLKDEVAWKTSTLLNLGPVILADIGLITLIVPQIVWYMTIGLFRRNKEPSRNALIAYRAGGAGALIVGIVFIFVAML
ncbi:MAG: hypothetical protein E7447_03750 [Ruminococcaceae bacterium]|nr:hypothetical protein [Oscillospiraceae bacterium]